MESSTENSEKYFRDYEDLEVHALMLKDRPRQEAYSNAISKNKAMFKDKVVLDVGAGTGILSALCAKAGARMVFAVEASNLARLALQIIEENNLTSKVKVVHSKIEDFTLPASIKKVDIIVSEWMGFYLLHEGMLDSVLYARDNFLKPDGLMFPSEAAIYVAPCSVPERFDYWNEIDGIRMTKFGEKLRQERSSKPEILTIEPDNLLHEGVVLYWMNLEEVSVKELDSINYKDIIPIQRSGKHQGFCIWFTVRFPGASYEEAVQLSTSPCERKTHWKQCIVVLPDGACEEMEEGAPVAFNMTMKRNAENPRKYDLEFELLDPNVEEHPVPCDCYLTKCILTKAHLQAMDTAE